MEKGEYLNKTMSRFMTGYALSKALLEDYAKVISKIEGSDEQ